MREIFKNIDLNDINILAGLILLGLGLNQISLELALIVVGSLIFILGVAGAIRKSGGRI